jgi:hypothetical protein
MRQSPRRSVVGVAGVVVALLGTGLGGTARAQDLSSFEGVATRLKPGATIRVTCTDGRELAGKLTQLSPSTLSLLSKGTTTDVRAGEIRSIHRRQPKQWARDVGIGLAAGSGVGFVLAAMSDNGWLGGPTLYLVSMGLFGGIGAGLGAGVAEGTPERSIPVYERKTATSSIRLGVSPVVTPVGKGVALTVRF